MMLKRKIEKEIMHWIESSNKALLIYGVRQAGKTFIIRECLKAAGCDYIEFNLIRQPEIVEILAGATSIDDLILKLSLYSDQKIVPGKTVFFFDEIQKYKEIATKVKFLVDDKRFRYILSGSLLWAPFTAVIKALMVLPFTAKNDRLLCRRNYIATGIAGVIGIAGYFVAACLLYTPASAVVEILPNLIQEAAGGVMYVLLALAMDRAKLKSRLQAL